METITQAPAEATAACEHPCMAQPQQEHAWLHRLVGEWRYEVESQMAPDAPPERSSGTESVRSLGGLWIVAEGQGEMPDGDPATTLMTLGYDPAQGRYLGIFIGSMMTHMWVYDGKLDADERVLSLECDGPSMQGDGGVARYQDAIELKSDDHRVLTASVRGDDGEWHTFMTANYWRTK